MGSINIEEIEEIKYSDDIVENIVSDDAVKEFNSKHIDAVSDAQFNLDRALDSYDPEFPNYTPSKNAFDFFNLMRLVQGADFEFSSPKAHYFMVDLLLGEIKDTSVFPYSEEVCKTIHLDALILSFMESRGMAKSTIVITFFVVYSAIKGELPNGLGKVYFYLILSASTKGGARVNALAVRSLCEESKFINSYFEKTRYTETEIEFVRRGSGKSSGRTFIARFQGVGTGIRGQRAQAGSDRSGGATRPNAIIFDDIILNTAAAYSKLIQSTLDDILNSDAENALVGGGLGRIINCFTPFHYSDVNVAPVLAGTTTQVVIPIAKSFNMEKQVEESDIKSSWMAMHPNKAIAKQFNNAFKKDKVSMFIKEKMLRLASAADRLIKKGQIQTYSRNQIEKYIGNYKLVATTDYTASNSCTGDYSCTMMWAVSSNNDWFLLDLSLKKEGIEEQYQHIFRMVQKYMLLGASYIEVAVEINGQQQINIHSLKNQMREKNIYFSFSRQIGKPYGSEGVSRSGSDKHGHFMRVHPSFQNKKIYFPEELEDTPDMIELREELNGITYTALTAVHDDGIDGISLIGMIDIILPAVEISSPVEHSKNRKGNPIWGDISFDDPDEDEFINSVVF